MKLNNQGVSFSFLFLMGDQSILVAAFSQLFALKIKVAKIKVFLYLWL